jgi:uncharacterized membrane protein YidH (DUF202 family)
MTKNFNRTDHLANERTFLAWIRTNLGIMAFGFVIERFSFFVKQIAIYSGNPEMPVKGSSGFGIILVAFGALLCLFAFLRFKETEKRINNNTDQPSILLNTILAFSVFLVGVFLVVYLIGSRK